MSGKCTICAHKDRKQIDEDLVGGGYSLNQLANRYSVSKDALWRHKANHLPPPLMQALAERSNGLLQQMEALASRTLRLLEAAEKKGDPRTALAAIREVRANAEMTARLLSAAHRQSAQTGLSGVSASGEPLDLSGLTAGEFIALGWILARIAGTDPPEPTSPAERRALAAMRPD